jgi:hypothetical protein
MPLAISMLLLDGNAPFSAEGIAGDLAANWKDLPPVTEIEAADGSLSFRLGDFDVALGQMPAPFPWSDLEGPCSTSTLWPNAALDLQRHNVHWIVTVRGDGTPVQRATALTQVTSAALSSCPPALGVYWPDATLLVPRTMFIEFAQEFLPYGPPLPIWVDIRVGWDSDKTSSGFTTGLASLGHMEFEAMHTPEKPSGLHDRFSTFASYVLENGPVIQDGDTVGADAKERIRVVYADSAFGHEGQVMRLEYGEAIKKGWWKRS